MKKDQNKRGEESLRQGKLLRKKEGESQDKVRKEQNQKKHHQDRP